MARKNEGGYKKSGRFKPDPKKDKSSRQTNDLGQLKILMAQQKCLMTKLSSSISYNNIIIMIREKLIIRGFEDVIAQWDLKKEMNGTRTKVEL